MAESSTKRASKSKLVLGILFGGLFAAVGLGVLLFLVLPTLLDAHAARAWLPTPALVESAELERHRGSKSQSYRVAARYRYTLDGVEHRGERVGLMEASDNIGDWHQRWHRQLSGAVESGEPIEVYVNPADPSQSIIDREIRWGQLGLLLLFPLAFGGGGIGIVVGAVLHYRKGGGR